MSDETPRILLFKATESETESGTETESEREERFRFDAGAITCELEEFGALAELLQKNSGGLTEASARALGDAITGHANTIRGSMFVEEDEEPSESEGAR